MFTTILILILAYLIGSFPSALVIGKYFNSTDVRNHGSKNLGATNTFRVLGKKNGLVVLALDVSKGTLAASLPLLLNHDLNILLAGALAILGHAYPIFANFRGGKSVATTGGILFVYNPYVLLWTFLIFLTLIFLFKFVSLASMIAVFSTVFTSFSIVSPVDAFIWLFIALFIIFKHHSNIQRIINCTEPKIFQKKHN